MLHNPINARLLPKLFEREFKNIGQDADKMRVISIPLPEKSAHVTSMQAHTDRQLERVRETLGYDFDYRSVAGFIIESNYGFPSQPVAVTDIFSFALSTCPNAEIVAYSTTEGSLSLLAEDPRIGLCKADAANQNEVLTQFSTLLALDENVKSELSKRVYSRDIAKEFVRSFNEKNLLLKTTPALVHHLDLKSSQARILRSSSSEENEVKIELGTSPKSPLRVQQ